MGASDSRGQPTGRFKDYFSGHARSYASARPRYPAALFAWLAEQCPGQDLAWDAATGNGQAALGLARHFRAIHATDASADQIELAPDAPGVTFAVERAERCSLPDASVDLVTVAQAAHWLDFDAFYAEVRRVARPEGVLALWCYGANRVAAEIDPIVELFYRETVGAYWPPERRHPMTGYRDLPFPFPRQSAPDFDMSCEWTVNQYLAYLRSWSASQRYLADRGEDPTEPLRDRLESAWGSGARTVRWPLSLLWARVHGSGVR